MRPCNGSGSGGSPIHPWMSLPLPLSVPSPSLLVFLPLYLSILLWANRALVCRRLSVLDVLGAWAQQKTVGLINKFANPTARNRSTRLLPCRFTTQLPACLDFSRGVGAFKISYAGLLLDCGSRNNWASDFQAFYLLLVSPFYFCFKMEWHKNFQQCIHVSNFAVGGVSIGSGVELAVTSCGGTLCQARASATSGCTKYWRQRLTLDHKLNIH